MIETEVPHTTLKPDYWILKTIIQERMKNGKIVEFEAG